MKAKANKGVFNLNPTKAVMKQGSELSREAPKTMPGRIGGASMPPAHETAADTANIGSAMSSKKSMGETHVNDFYGVENLEHSAAHPAMQTRISHAKNAKHSDGRKHEDHHSGVLMAKGKM